MVTIEINNIYGKVMDKLGIEYLAAIQRECQFKMEGSEFKAWSYRKRNIDWDGYK